MSTFIRVTLKISEKKFNTLFSSKGNQKEFGKNCTKLLIPQMCFCMFWMPGILTEPELSLLNTTSSISARTSTWSLFSINAISSQRQSHKNGSNICPRQPQLSLSKLLFLIPLEKGLWSNCSNNSISSIKIRKTFPLVWSATPTSENLRWSTPWWKSTAAELPQSRERPKCGNILLWPREFTWSIALELCMTSTRPTQRRSSNV